MTSNEDKPSRLERLATAVSTSNLTFDPIHRMPVDTIIALGLASMHSSVTSNVLRLYLVGSPEAWHAAKASVLAVVRKLNEKRRWDIGAKTMDKVATDALLHHINPTCSHCKGRGYQMIAGTPSLSHKPCEHCKGTGRRPLNRKLSTYIAATLASLEHIDAITEAAVGRRLR